MFLRVDLAFFWSSILGSYPIVSEIVLKLLMPFPSTYLCEAAFSSMLVIKTKARNRFDVEPDLLYCLAVTQPRIQNLLMKNNINNRIKYFMYVIGNVDVVNLH